MKQLSLNRIIGIFLVGLSIAFCLASVKLGVGEFRNPSSGFMPFFTSSLLFFLSIGVLFKSFIEKDEGGDKEPLIMVGGNLQKPLSLVAALSIYTLLLNVFGYLITTFFLISLVLFIFDPNLKNWWKCLVIGAITVSLSFLIFSKWFQVQLPMSVFGIGF